MVSLTLFTVVFFCCCFLLFACFSSFHTACSILSLSSNKGIKTGNTELPKQAVCQVTVSTNTVNKQTHAMELAFK